MQTHLAELPLELDPKLRGSNPSHTILAVEPRGRAVIFVHGFGGGALTTWSEFNTLLPLEPEANGVDLFFYGYDSLYADVRAAASIFCDFLDDLMTHPSAVVNPLILSPDLNRADSFRYREILLVAHSLGAVVVRRALIHACESNKDWISRLRLILFAPAHCGARIVELSALLAAGSLWLSFTNFIGRLTSPSLSDLDPNSEFLRELSLRTSELTSNGQNPRLRPECVVHAERENLVYTTSFAGDPPMVALPGTTHTTLCKPRSAPKAFTRPLEIVLKALRSHDG